MGVALNRRELLPPNPPPPGLPPVSRPRIKFPIRNFWAVDFDHHDGQPFNHHWQDYAGATDTTRSGLCFAFI